MGRENTPFVLPEKMGPVCECALVFFPQKVEKRELFNKNNIMLFKEYHRISCPEKITVKKKCGRLSLGDIYGIFLN